MYFFGSGDLCSRRGQQRFEGLCLTDRFGKGRNLSSRSFCNCAASCALHPGIGAAASSSSRFDHVIDNDDAYIHNAVFINNNLNDENVTNTALEKHETTIDSHVFPSSRPSSTSQLHRPLTSQSRRIPIQHTDNDDD